MAVGQGLRGFLDSVVPDSYLEDLLRLVARRHLALKQVGHLHGLLDLFHRGDAYTLPAPQVILDANPDVVTGRGPLTPFAGGTIGKGLEGFAEGRESDRDAGCRCQRSEETRWIRTAAE